MSYDIGDAVPLLYTINAVATVALTVTAPDGTITTPSTTQGGAPPTVTYTANVPATQTGTWRYRFAATGAVTDAEQGQFFVVAAVTDQVYTTLPELKASFESLPPTDTTDDDDLQDAILVASRAIDADCQRHFYKLTEARTFTPTDYYCLKLGAFNDLVSVTTLKTDAGGDGTYETTWQTTDYQLLTLGGSRNVNAGPEPQPYTQIRAVGTQMFPLPWAWNTRADRVEITGTWGWPVIPDAIRRACRLLAAEQFKLREAPFGVAGFDQWGPVRVRDNPKVARLLAPYRRYPVPVA